MLLCIYNKEIHGFISLNFWLCYLHITECNLHSLPYLFVSVHATLLLFHMPKGHTASWCKTQKRSTKSEKERGRVGERSHKLCRPWLRGCWKVLRFVRWTTKIAFCAIQADSEHMRAPSKGAYGVAKFVYCAWGASIGFFVAILQRCEWRWLFTYKMQIWKTAKNEACLFLSITLACAEHNFTSSAYPCARRDYILVACVSFFLKPKLKDVMIGKVFKLEIDCRKYCGKLFQFLCVHRFGIKTPGTVSVPLVNISGIITSLNSSSYASLAVISNIKMPSISAMFFPSTSWNGSRKSYICYYFIDRECERKKNERTQSQSIAQGWGQSETSGLVQPYIPVCSQSNTVTQKSVPTLQNLLCNERKNYTNVCWSIYKISLITFFF